VLLCDGAGCQATERLLQQVAPLVLWNSALPCLSYTRQGPHLGPAPLPPCPPPCRRYLGMNVDKVQLGTASLRKYAQVLFQTGGWPWLQRLLQVRGACADLCCCGAGLTRCNWRLI
jgi:hypothetical protein